MADLVFEAPAVKKKTPIHLADLNLAERKERAVELGLPAFRANQLAVHFFTHHNDDVESFTDIPKELRTTVGDAFLPKLLTLVRSVTCDGGRTRKDLWRLHDGV
jgi:23S rRNA (adenine2503-C2)-methyltransferase